MKDISDTTYQQCGEIEYEGWKNDLVDIIGADTFTYYLTPKSLAKELKEQAEKENFHLLFAKVRVVPTYTGIDPYFKIAGFLLLEDNKYHKKSFIRKLFVRKEFQGKGMGTRLLMAAKDTAIYNISANCFEGHRKYAHMLLKTDYSNILNSRPYLIKYGGTELRIPQKTYNYKKKGE